jgi:hypothetical protein
MVLVAVVALVIGSFGTATAGGLTKGKVKAIATKVVKKQAPSLTVANAANATNATNLNGQPSSTYLTSAIRFRLPSGGASSTRTYTFAVPAGVYDVDYSVIAQTTAAASFLTCGLYPSASTATGSEGRTYGTPANFGNYWAATGSATLNVASGVATLQCSSGSTFNVNPDPDTLSHVTFTRVNTLTDKNATSSRPANRPSDGSSSDS